MGNEHIFEELNRELILYYCILSIFLIGAIMSLVHFIIKKEKKSLGGFLWCGFMGGVCLFNVIIEQEEVEMLRKNHKESIAKTIKLYSNKEGGDVEYTFPAQGKMHTGRSSKRFSKKSSHIKVPSGYYKVIYDSAYPPNSALDYETKLTKEDFLRMKRKENVNQKTID